MIKRIIIIILLIVLLLFLLIIGGSYLMLGTDKGFRWTTKKLNEAVPGLVVAPTTGNLESGIQTDQISWNQDGIEVAASGLSSQWDSGCLLQSRYCLKKLQLDSVTIKSRPTDKSVEKAPESISLPTIKLPINIEADDISIDRLTLDLSEEGDPIVLEDISLRAQTQGSALAIRDFTTRYKNFSLQLNSDIELENDYKLKANATLFATDFIDDKDIQVNLAASNSLRNLDLTGTVSGAVNLKLRGLAEPLEPGVPLNLNAYWEELGWPLDTHETIKSIDGLLYMDGTLDDYEIAYSSEIDGDQVPQSSIELKGKINPARALLHTVNLFTLDGFFTGSAAAKWDDNITWLAELIAKEINPGKEWPDMDGKLNGLFKANGFAADGKWTLDLHQANIDGTLRRFPLALNTRVIKSSDGIWTIPQLKLENGPNTFDLNGTIGETMDLNTTINFPAVHYLIPTVAGNLTGAATITGDPVKPDVDFNAKSAVLKTPGALFRNLVLTADIKEALEAPGNIKLKVGKLNVGTQELSRLDARFDGQKSDHVLTAKVTGPQASRVTLKTKGSLSPELDWQGKLLSKTITLPGQQWKLAKPVDLSWQQNDKKFRIAAHCWTQQSAKLCLERDIIAADKGEARLSLSDYSLNSLNSELPDSARLGGVLSASSSFSWGGKSLPFSAELDAVIDRGSLSVIDDAKTRHRFVYQALKLKATARPDAVDVQATLNSDALGNGSVSLKLNPEDKTKSINGDIALKGFDLTFLEAFLPDFNKIDGTVSVAGKLSGSLSDPSFNGAVSLANPRVRAETLPISIEGGNLTVNVNGKDATLDGKLNTTEDKATGQILIGGDVSWKNKTVQADVDITGDSLAIEQSPITRSSINPNLRIRYTPKGLLISGRVDVPLAQIDIKELPEGTTSLSDDVIVIEDVVEEEQGGNAGSGLPVSVKVNVGLGDDVNLSGFGLKAQLNGDFTVSKDGQKPPQLLGEIRVVEGLYKSYGQDLQIKDGQILFVGPIDQTTLDIDAYRDIDNEDRIAGLHLDGPIADPKVTLFSEPADKSQESILSYIVLGRDLGSGSNTASEQNLLATAALALTIRQGKGFATGFAESLGISDFTLEADGSGDDTQVVVSGRLSSKLLLRYGRSVFVPQDTLFLRYDISKRMYLEAAQGLERAVDVFYSFSF